MMPIYRLTRNVYLTYLLVGLYIGIIVWGTTDLQIGEIHIPRQPGRLIRPLDLETLKKSTARFVGEAPGSNGQRTGYAA